MQKRQFYPGIVMTKRRLDPLENDRTYNQETTADQQPMVKPELVKRLRPSTETFPPPYRPSWYLYVHESRLNFFAQEATMGERKAIPSRAWPISSVEKVRRARSTIP